MRNIEKRLQEIERKIGTKERKPLLWITPDTTFDEAKADYEKQTGKGISKADFERVIPSLPKTVFTIVTREGTTENSWINNY